MESAKDLAIRAARPEDLPAIYDLMAACGMAGEFSAQGCYLAESRAGLAGFARVETAGQGAYLRPIVVDPDHQGQGIGRALLEYVLGLDPGLIVIARGSAAGFYAQLGFERIDWGAIPQGFQDECTACPDLSSCGPVPMQHGSMWAR